MKINEMEVASLTTLRSVAADLNIPNAQRLKKENLILNIRKAEAAAEGIEVKGGVLEITPEGVGFCGPITRSVRMMFMSHRRSCGAMSCAWATT